MELRKQRLFYEISINPTVFERLLLNLLKELFYYL